MRVCVTGCSPLEDIEEECRDAELKLGSTNNWGGHTNSHQI